MCKNFVLSETLPWGSLEFIKCGVGKDVGSVANFGYLKVLSCEPTSVKDSNIWNSFSSPIGIFPELSHQLSSICAVHKTWMFVPEVKPKWFTVDEGFWQGCLLGHRTCKRCTHSVCIRAPHFASFSSFSVVVFIFTTCEKVIMNYSKPVIMIKSNTGYLFLWFLVFWFLCLCSQLLYPNDYVFCHTEYSQLHEILIIIVVFSGCAISVLLRDPLLVSMSSRLSFSFLSTRFSASGLILKSLISLNVTLVQGDKYGSLCILLYAVKQFVHQHL